MDFLKKFAESATETKNESPADKSAAPAEESSLFSSAKLVADAARSTFQNEPDSKKYDNAEVAGAAADLLDAAQNYGKLDKTSGVGSYVEKAENYLHEYKTSHSTKPKTSEEPKPPTDQKEEKPVTEEPKPSSEKEEVHEEPKKEEEPSETAKPSADSGEKTSGLGDYAKIAEGFLSKPSDSEGNKADTGGLLKMAGGFLGKN